MIRTIRKYVLDTQLFIDAFRDPTANDALQQFHRAFAPFEYLSVIVAQELLQTMGFRSFTPLVVACPGCGRTTSTYFQELAQKIQAHLRLRMPEWRRFHPGVEEMTVAVMGCVVNGPGESKHANIGISLPGTGERPVAPVYIDGEKGPTLKGERIAEEFQELVEQYVVQHYTGAAP